MKDQELIRGINSPENGGAIRKVCAQFVALCRQLGLLAAASVAVDGSKFKAVNSEAPNAIGPSERAERPEFHPGQDAAADGADRDERRALSRPAGQC